jgi:hypothetical protein
LITDGQVHDGVQNIQYLGMLINSKNETGEEIKSRIAAGNRCYYSLKHIFRSRTMSKIVKIKNI